MLLLDESFKFVDMLYGFKKKFGLVPYIFGF